VRSTPSNPVSMILCILIFTLPMLIPVSQTFNVICRQWFRSLLQQISTKGINLMPLTTESHFLSLW
jgi:hypothetical protein